MTNVTSAEEFMKRKRGEPCSLCGVPHKPETLCARQALADRIVKLMEVNSFIPILIKNNKEATELAQGYKEILKRADESHAILMGLLAEHGGEGEEIKTEYLKRLDAWATGNAPTNPDTTDQLGLFDPEHLTSNVTAIKDSTTPLNGSPSEKDSSQ